MKYDAIHDYIFQRVRISNGETIHALTGGARKKAEAFVALKTINAIKVFYDKSLNVKDYIFHDSWSPELIYISLITEPNGNHPVVAFASIYEPYIYMVRPYGKDTGQVSLDQFENLLDSKFKSKVTLAEYYALYLLFSESVRQRKQEMLFHDKHSLLKCNNIKQCVTKQKQIMKAKKMPLAEKRRELQKFHSYYEKKSIRMIEKYFELLDNRQYAEAYAFLKIKNSKYFGKQRLDTFFVSTGAIIGHLQIFIDIYQFIYLLIDRFNDAKSG
jgi:hypothetical protein